MGLSYNFMCEILFLIFLIKLCYSSPPQPFQNISDFIPCPDYGPIEFATIKSIDVDSFRLHAIHIECNAGYELAGRHKLLCNDGKWEPYPRPQCVAKCDSPPNIENGKLSIEREGERDRSGHYRKGTLAIYSCNAGYQLSPPDSQYRVCEKGIWTGASASCVPIEQITACKQPKDIIYGYYVPEKNGVVDGFGIGQRLHYSCNSGYVLDGSSVQQCLEDGTWSPRIPPNCIAAVAEFDGDGLTADMGDYFLPCPILPVVSHASMKVMRGSMEQLQAPPDTVVEYRCDNGYRIFSPPCEPAILRCKGGIWLGELPSCIPVKGCILPPNISNGHIVGVIGQGIIGDGPSGQTQGQNMAAVARYVTGVKVLYQCLPGFEMHGSRLLSCSPTGCWEPLMRHPTCLPDEQLLDMSTSGTLLVSVATASGVMLILLAVCLVVICRRRKPWGQRPLAPGVSVGTTVPHHHLPHHHHPSDVGVNNETGVLSGTLDPDRLALIAFADGMQGNGYQQLGLPSYEEATRERSSGPGSAGLLGYRPHRAHWTMLGASRRPRPSGPGQSPADVHVTRQSSCTSHTPSMRSGSAGDPMGSTDTMTPSEVSTNVTLDTVSSHSGSQPASCRAICGSLASFDTSSALNNEGVPLLEENETEETLNAETSSMGVDHRSIADNSSFKYRRASPDLA